MPLDWGSYASGIGQGILDRMAGSAWDSFWGGITTGNWGGGTSKERKNQIHDIRTLRRREYQDMVHSLTEAGLNPVLAVGASPGHATAQLVSSPTKYQGGVGGAAYSSAGAMHRQAGVSESKAPIEIESIKTNTGNAMLDRANILQKFDLDQATIDRIREETKTQRALQELYSADAINKGASADKLQKDIEMLDKYGPPGASIMRALLGEAGKPSHVASAKDFAGGMAKDIEDFLAKIWKYLSEDRPETRKD